MSEDLETKYLGLIGDLIESKRALDDHDVRALSAL